MQHFSSKGEGNIEVFSVSTPDIQTPLNTSRSWTINVWKQDFWIGKKRCHIMVKIDKKI